MSDADVRRPVPAWLWGGGLLAASAALPMLGQSFYGTPVLLWTARLLAAAALVVFALGVRGEGSVVARRPVGTVALFVLAIVPPLIELLTPALVMPSTTSGLPDNLWLVQVMGYGGIAIAGAAALVAVVEIARARVVPDPWRWAPTWALAAIAGAYVLSQVLIVAAGAAVLETYATLLAITGAAAALVPLALGILAMVLGARGLAAAPAQVYPPPAG